MNSHPVLDKIVHGQVQEMEIPMKIISCISETVSSRNQEVLLLSIVSMAISMQQSTWIRVSQILILVINVSHFSQVLFTNSLFFYVFWNILLPDISKIKEKNSCAETSWKLSLTLTSAFCSHRPTKRKLNKSQRFDLLHLLDWDWNFWVHWLEMQHITNI